MPTPIQGRGNPKSKPNPDSKQFKTKADRRKALLRIQQGGAQQVGKVYDDAIKVNERKQLATKAILAVDAATAVVSPVGAAKKVVTKIATESAKKMAKTVAEKKATRAITHSAKVGARREALKAEAKQIQRAGAKDRVKNTSGTTREVRKRVEDQLKKNQKAAKQADIDAKPKHRNPGTRNKATEVKGPTASTPPKRSGPDRRQSSATHTDHKAARRENPRQTVGKHKRTTQEYPRLPKDTTKPLQGPGLKPTPSKPKFGNKKVTVKKDPVTVNKRGADYTKAERDARKVADMAKRKKSHGVSGREKLKAADASKKAQKASGQKNFLTQGPKGAARRQRLGVKRDTKAGRKEAGRNFIVMEH
jgi:hypothetical protein